jgi:hypothetical protein
VTKEYLPTAYFRFINRDGKRILQQQWHCWMGSDEYATGEARPLAFEWEWKDIPYIPGAEQGDMTVHP